MNSVKCPKCGFMTFSTAASCRNCNYKFTAQNPINNLKMPNKAAEKPLTWAETFCGINLIGSAIFFGVVFCLYWNTYVLSLFLPSGTYPLILLILFYLPAGILAIVLGIAWFAVLRFIFGCFGFTFAEDE